MLPLNVEGRTWLLSVILLFAVAPAQADCRQQPGYELHDCFNNEGWKRKLKDQQLSVYARSRRGSDVREVLAVTQIDAPLQTIVSALTDFNNYTSFMPGTLEKCEQLQRDGDSYWVFQQLNLPLVSDRYYTIRLQLSEPTEFPDWTVLQWTLATEPGYQRKGRGSKVEFNDGYWSLRPQPDGSTQVIYYIHTDPGHLWSWVVDLANNKAVPDVVKAVKRKIEKDQAN